MKKLIALLMATFMVLSLCAVCAIAEGETLVSGGKAFTISGNGNGYNQYHTDLTDGVALDAISYEEGKWFGFYHNKDYEVVNAPDGVGHAIIDLGEKVENLTTFKAHLFNGASGIKCPKAINIYVSDDGTNFTAAGSFDTAELKDHLNNNGSPTPYWVSLTLKKGVSGRYVKFEFELSGVFVFTDELEVYASAASSEPVKPAEPTTTTIDLLTMLGEGEKVDAEWNGTVGKIAYTLENGVLTATGDAVWPSVTFPFTQALSVDVANTRLVLEATIENGDGCIRLLGADDGAANDDIYLHQFVEGTTLSGGGDLVGPATVNLDIAFSDLAFCDYSAETNYAGKIAFTTDTVELSKLQITAVSGATVKVTKLQLVVTTEGGNGDTPTIPSTGDNGIVALTILAIVAMFGSAIIVKSRH